MDDADNDGDDSDDGDDNTGDDDDDDDHTCGRPTQEASRHECRQSRPEIINFNEFIVFSL